MASSKSLSLTLGIVVAMISPAVGQQVGTATAVNQSTEATLPGGSPSPLSVGAHVVDKEKIHTSPSGSAQLLFFDQSSLSIAANTSIVIDQFVYDPNSHSGHSVTKLTRGALRFVGGQLSHLDEAAISTPAAAIGIRGGTATISIGPNGVTVTTQNGTATITNATGTITLPQNFSVTILNWYTPPGTPIWTETDLAENYVETIMSRYYQNGGVSGYQGETPICGTATTLTCPQPPWVSIYDGEYNATQIIVQGVQHGTNQTPPPPPPPE
jgi:FecR protein